MDVYEKKRIENLYNLINRKTDDIFKDINLDDLP